MGDEQINSTLLSTAQNINHKMNTYTQESTQVRIKSIPNPKHQRNATQSTQTQPDTSKTDRQTGRETARHNPYHENASSNKSTLFAPSPCSMPRTASLTSSPIAPGPHTLTAIAPTCACISCSRSSLKRGFPGLMSMGTVGGARRGQGSWWWSTGMLSSAQGMSLRPVT